MQVLCARMRRLRISKYPAVRNAADEAFRAAFRAGAKGTTGLQARAYFPSPEFFAPGSAVEEGFFFLPSEGSHPFCFASASRGERNMAPIMRHTRTKRIPSRLGSSPVRSAAA